jgi:hypothetical protein
MTARFTPPAVDAANRPFEYRWCGYRYQMPPTAIWITPERFPHGRGRLFLGNVDHALDDHWCDTNQVRQRYHSCHAFVVLRILCGRAAATGRIPFFVGGPGSTLNTLKLVAPPTNFKVFKVGVSAFAGARNFENFEIDGAHTKFNVFKVGVSALTGARNFENFEIDGAPTKFKVFKVGPSAREPNPSSLRAPPFISSQPVLLPGRALLNGPIDPPLQPKTNQTTIQAEVEIHFTATHGARASTNNAGLQTLNTLKTLKTGFPSHGRLGLGGGRGLWGPFVSLHLCGLWRPGGKSRLRGVWAPFALSVSTRRAHVVPMSGHALGDLLRRECWQGRWWASRSGLPQFVPQELLSSSSWPATDCHGLLLAL